MDADSRNADLERFYTAALSIVGAVRLVWLFAEKVRRGGPPEKLYERNRKVVLLTLRQMAVAIKTPNALPQIDELVKRHGSGVFRVCGKHGASVHAAVFELGNWVWERSKKPGKKPTLNDVACTVWGLMNRYPNALDELDHARVALEAEKLKVAVALETAPVGGGKAAATPAQPQGTATGETRGQVDTKMDKKKLSTRGLTSAARRCANTYKAKHKAGQKTTMKAVILDYIDEHDGKFYSIRKSLSAHPEAWKLAVKVDKAGDKAVS